MKLSVFIIFSIVAFQASALTLKDLSFEKYETKIEEIEMNKREPASIDSQIEVVIQPACQAPTGLSVYERNPAYEECLNWQTRTQSTSYEETAKALVIRASVHEIIDK